MLERDENVPSDPLNVLHTAGLVVSAPQLLDFIESDDVDGVASTVATQSDALALSSVLLHRAIDSAVGSGHLGLFEATVTCVVRRCRSVDVDMEVGGTVGRLQRCLHLGGRVLMMPRCAKHEGGNVHGGVQVTLSVPFQGTFVTFATES